LDETRLGELEILSFCNFQDLNAWFANIELKDGRILLDVTDLTEDDVQYSWGMIEIARQKSGLTLNLRPGRPKGVKTRHEVLDGKTWAEIREYIKQNPQECNSLWIRYVKAQGGPNPEERRKTRRNFYQQVHRHPDMRQLNLPRDRRGRPRQY
jgi:hypothetical protein